MNFNNKKKSAYIVKYINYDGLVSFELRTEVRVITVRNTISLFLDLNVKNPEILFVYSTKFKRISTRFSAKK